MYQKKYTCGTDTYEVCTVTSFNEMDEDYNNVMTLGIELHELYKPRMDLSMQQELAYRIYKNGVLQGFVYNYLENNRYYGASIYYWGDNVGMLLMFKAMFEVADKHRIIFTPHNQQELKQFKSLISGKSIRLYHNNNHSVTILKKDIEPLGLRLFDYLGVAEV